MPQVTRTWTVKLPPAGELPAWLGGYRTFREACGQTPGEFRSSRR